VAAALARCALAGLVVAIALAVPVGLLTVRVHDDHARESFERLAVLVAGSVVGPVTTDALVRGEPAAVDLMARRVGSLVAADSISRVTVLDADGRRLWPRESAGALPAARLSPGERRALQTRSVVSSGDGDSPRTAAVGVAGADGNPTLVDVTESAGATSASGSIWNRYALPTIAALLLLEVVQIPFAYGVASRARRQRRAEAALAQAAADAVGAERRRVAGAVHDYVLPEMTGLAYGLDATRLGASGAQPPAVVLERTARGLRHCVDELRSMLSDRVQPRVPDVGLGEALRVLGDGLGGTDPTVSVQIDAPESLPQPVSELLYRCAQESLRNAVTHSRAEQVEIVIAHDPGRVTMIIDDDGCGFDEVRLAERTAAGHLGLRTMGDLVAAGGGSLTTRSAPGQGTRLAITVPLTSASSRQESGR
jgi:signal transduction histidine kinase